MKILPLLLSLLLLSACSLFTTKPQGIVEETPSGTVRQAKGKESAPIPSSPPQHENALNIQ